MSIVMLFGAILEWAKPVMKGFQRLGSNQLGHPFRFLIALVHTVPMALSKYPMFPRLPRKMQNGAKLISMVMFDIYGSIPEGFS